MSAKNTKLPARARLRDQDAYKNVQPKIRDDGLASSDRQKPFDDRQTVDFVETQVSYPSMIISSSPLADSPGITALGRQTPGVSDVHFTYASGSIAPFIEHNNDYHSRSFYLDTPNGMDESFTGPLSSRSAIKIDISSTTQKFVYRCSQYLISQSPGGEFTKPGTGFCYFNFVNKRWEDIGLTDPASGASVLSDQVAKIVDIAGDDGSTLVPVLTGSEMYMGQFMPPNHINSRGKKPGSVIYKCAPFSSEEQEVVGSKTIGSPTLTYLAPAANKYHATSSFTLRMSDYITGPFLLEGIRVKLPIAARRVQEKSVSSYNVKYTTPVGGATTNQFNDLYCRDMDNYVFFVYRQIRNGASELTREGELIRDNNFDVSGSDRYLIASASMCFVNRPTHRAGMYGRGKDTDYAYETDSENFPYHTPAFTHDFNMSVIAATASVGPRQESFFVGSVELEMKPEVCAAGKIGSSFVPVRGDASYVGNVGIFQHAWSGTAGSFPLGVRNISVHRSYPYSGKTIGATTVVGTHIGVGTVVNPEYHYTNFTGIDEFKVLNPGNMSLNRNYPFRTESVLNTHNREFLSSFGPGRSSEKTAFTSAGAMPTEIHFFGAKDTTPSRASPSPVVLLPTDELVLGIDAGIAPFMLDNSAITGSYLRIDPGDAYVMLFGSQVVDGKRRQNVTTQETRSAGVFRAVGETPVDEFLVDTLSTNFGNYYTPLATGSFGERIVQNIAYFPVQYKVGSKYQDWFHYSRVVAGTDDTRKPVDSGSLSFRYVFRSDKFGMPAHMLLGSVDSAALEFTRSILSGGGTRKITYPVSSVVSGSSSITADVNLHVTGTGPFRD